MYKLIIIDDEFVIRKGLENFIKKRYPEISIVGCFEDGEDAISFLECNNVNIVITDVKMIKVSGIEVAKYICEKQSRAKVIILSGYREFEYARKAIAYNVKHYLVKPTDFKELEAVLSETLSELEAEQAHSQRESYWEQYVPILKEEFLSDLLMGAIYDKNSLSCKFGILETDMQLENCAFCVVDLVIENYHNYLSSNWSYGKEQLNKATINFIKTQNAAETFVFHVLSDDDRMKLFMVLPREGKGDIAERAREHLQLISKNAEENLHIKFKFSLEKTYSSADEMLSSNDNESVKQNEKQINLLISHINFGNYNEISALTKDIGKQLSNMSMEKAFDYARSLLCKIKEKVAVASAEMEVSNIFSDCKTFDEVTQILLSEFTRLSKQIKKTNSENVMIEHAKNYIGKHFNEDISLEDVSNHIFLNPAYFSRYFKKYTGKNFSQYVFELRMEHAKKLLSAGNSVEQTAKACGYSASRYFVQSFKRYAGVTPKQYRMMSVGEGGE